MCGINGIFAYHYAANPIDRDELIRTRDYMARCGPDGKGAWISEDGRVGLGHRRLAVTDLSERAAQPMASVNGKHVVAFNGRIYNFRELEKQLEARGHVFKSSSDTEVLLHLYAEKGEEMVLDLRGMFAFAIWDVERKRLILARDPYGIKPLYYADDGWTLRFASQVKALIAGNRCSSARDPAGVVGFYLFGSVPEPHTMFAAIRALPAGTTMIVDRTGPHQIKRYYSIARVYSSGPTSSVVRRGDICEALSDSVRHHLIADVPIGAFLSASIASGSVVGLMRDANQVDMQTITLRFEEFRDTPNDEGPLAAKIARQYGTCHRERVVSRPEYEEDFPKILAAMDQPSIEGINTWFVSKAAHELGLKVAVSGLGGNELFGGYPSFSTIPRLVQKMRWLGYVPIVPRGVRALASKIDLARFGISPKVAGLAEIGGTFEGAFLLTRGLFMPWELPRVMDSDFAAEGLRRLAPLRYLSNLIEPKPGSDFAKVAVLETALYMRNQLLRDADWASMAHGLEVRFPLADTFLLKYTAPHIIASELGEGMRILAACPSRPLHRDLLSRPKINSSLFTENGNGRVRRDTFRAERPVFPPARNLAHIVAAAYYAN